VLNFIFLYGNVYCLYTVGNFLFRWLSLTVRQISWIVKTRSFAKWCWQWAYLPCRTAQLHVLQNFRLRMLLLLPVLILRLVFEGKFWFPLCQFSRNCLVLRNAKIVQSVSILRWQCGEKTYLAGSERKSSSTWQLMSMNYPYICT
jgi:hypothetical protein